MATVVTITPHSGFTSLTGIWDTPVFEDTAGPCPVLRSRAQSDLYPDHSDSSQGLLPSPSPTSVYGQARDSVCSK